MMPTAVWEHLKNFAWGRIIRRLTIIVACLVLSPMAISISYFTISSIFSDSMPDALRAVVALLAVAWLCFLVMAAGWVREKKVHKAWPIAGVLAAALVTFYFPFAPTSAVPTIGLTAYLIWFHLGLKIPSLKKASR